MATDMTFPPELKRALYTILIGACVAFVSSLLTGLEQLLHGMVIPAAASGSAMVHYVKWRG